VCPGLSAIQEVGPCLRLPSCEGVGKCGQKGGAKGAAALFVLCVERPFSPWSQLAPGGQETDAGKRSPLAVDFPFSSPGGGCRCSYKIPRDGYTETERERESEASGKSFGQ